jgi:hypothetical protein
MATPLASLIPADFLIVRVARGIPLTRLRGLTSVGVPIRDHVGLLVGVINISGPTARLITRSTR